MLCRVKSSVLTGLTAYQVDVEVEASDGKNSYVTIGMGDVAVRESKDRVLSAIKKCKLQINPRILVSLAPAELKKEGSAFDLAIAIGIIAASWTEKDPLMLAGKSFVGELALDGRVRPVRGIVAHAIEALERGLDEIIVAKENEAEAKLVSGITVTAVASLAELVSYLCGELIPEGSDYYPSAKERYVKTFADVKGQRVAKRAMLIAAAGGHNLIMVGPPGCGKSMLAERFPALLPPLSQTEILETAKIHSVAGLPIENLLAGVRPFRSPHHVVSEAGLIGGGSIPRPGEVSLAHHGVLFLDEFPEFKRGVLESLRQPLETGRVRVSRAKTSIEYPASFQLIAAMNPCPCGRLGVKGTRCICQRGAVLNYLKRLSLPILDRIDLHVDVEAVPLTELSTGEKEVVEHSKMCEQIMEVREISQFRSGCVNARISSGAMEAHIKPKADAINLLKRMGQKSNLSARGFFRILKVSRTIADLRGSAFVEEQDVAEAAGYRSLQRIEDYCMSGV